MMARLDRRFGLMNWVRRSGRLPNLPAAGRRSEEPFCFGFMLKGISRCPAGARNDTEWWVFVAGCWGTICLLPPTRESVFL